MDWTIIIAAVVGIWAILKVLASERFTQTEQLEMARLAALQAQAAAEAEIPIALSAEASLVGSPAAFNRKAA